MIPFLSTIAGVLPLATMASRLWYALPLVVSVSLVYAATRHEDVFEILKHAWRFGMWILLFMLAVAAVVQITTWTL